MEVLHHQPQQLFGAPPSAMVFPPVTDSNLSQLSVPPARMFGTPPSAAYTCYSFQSTLSPYTPSRTPTPEYPRSGSRESNMAGQGGTTLQSVLRGEVPKAYSHFMSSSSSSANEFQPSPAQSPVVASSSSSPAGLGAAGSSSSSSSSSSGVFGGPTSSLLGAESTPVLSPPPEDVQTEPMDLSCKRPASTSSVTSSSSAFHHTLPPSPCEDHHGQASEFSLLRNLLQVGKAPQPFSSYPSHSSPASDRSCDSPCSDSGTPAAAGSGTTQVTLADENLYNVNARVSDWLMNTVKFASNIPCFKTNLGHHDRQVLLLNSWSRLLLLFMAENNFQFAVTPLKTDPAPCGVECGPDQPTMKSVEGISRFIRKCQHLGVEGEEYYFLRMLVLFNTSYVGLQEASVVDAINAQVTTSLKQHVQNTRPDDVMRYSRLLLCLPSLYGINDKMVERLFCRHIDTESITEVEGLLKRLLQTFFP